MPPNPLLTSFGYRVLAAWGGGEWALKTLILITASSVAVGGLYAGGAFDRGEVYAMPLSLVRARLVSVQFPAMAAMAAAGTDRAIRANVSDNRVRWTLNERTGATFTATMQPEGPLRTRVVLDYQPGETGDGHAERLLATAFMRDFAETSFREEVDARIEGRAPDHDRALQDFAARTAADPSYVRELGLAVEGMMNDVHEQAQGMQPSADYRSAVSTQENMRAATRPSVVLPTN